MICMSTWGQKRTIERLCVENCEILENLPVNEKFAKCEVNRGILTHTSRSSVNIIGDTDAGATG